MILNLLPLSKIGKAAIIGRIPLFRTLLFRYQNQQYGTQVKARNTAVSWLISRRIITSMSHGEKSQDKLLSSLFSKLSFLNHIVSSSILLIGNSVWVDMMSCFYVADVARATQRIHLAMEKQVRSGLIVWSHTVQTQIEPHSFVEMWLYGFNWSDNQYWCQL